MIHDIMIVGGGSAGWMSAATLIKEFPDKKIALIESPEIATVGVGESTIQQVRYWTNFLGIKEDQFLRHTDGTYKLSIRFTDFYKKGESFHYPFGTPLIRESPDGPVQIQGVNDGWYDWWYKKAIFPETPYTDYANSYSPQMALVNQNKLSFNENQQYDNFRWTRDTAFHFDATKFGIWLRDNYCLPKGLVHIKEHITDIKQNEDGIESLNEKHKAKLFIDCTGFSSLLLGKTLKVPYKSYFPDLIPNNSAWTTKLPYKDKKQELRNYTDCKAVENGWIWRIPLWSRMGTGYVYSDKFIDDDGALKQFQKHLGTDELEFKKIKMRCGVHERLWEKNVVAIGLSAGFIEPLESTGLMTVHEFLRELIKEKRDRISQWDRDNFTYRCKSVLQPFAEFVARHYALSHRNDTEYWKHIQNQTFLKEEWPTMYGLAHARLKLPYGQETREGGTHYLAAGMHYSPIDMTDAIFSTHTTEENIKHEWMPYVENLTIRSKRWEETAKNEQSIYDFLKQNIYN